MYFVMYKQVYSQITSADLEKYVFIFYYIIYNMKIILFIVFIVIIFICIYRWAESRLLTRIIWY